VDDVRIAPDGDPFTSAAPEDQDEHPCCCNGGWVTIGQLVACEETGEETGEETEEFALYLCRRCAVNPK